MNATQGCGGRRERRSKTNPTLKSGTAEWQIHTARAKPNCAVESTIHTFNYPRLAFFV